MTKPWLSLSVVVGLVFMLAVSGCTDFQAAEDAYNRGDYETALKGVRPLAAKGDAWAQFNLGRLYREGKGVPQDYTEAMKWYRLAADQGDAAAQYLLGVMYDQGLGVLLDYQEAAQWCRLAAEQGHAGAQVLLGTLYHLGQGVPRDDALAHMWVTLAAAHGIEVAVKWRDLFEKSMTTAQLMEAQRLAREWTPTGK